MFGVLPLHEAPHASQLSHLGLDRGRRSLHGESGHHDHRDRAARYRAGYRGRLGIFELLVVNNALRELILNRRAATELRAVALRSMTTMQQDALGKAVAGLTTLEEIIRVCAGDALE